MIVPSYEEYVELACEEDGPVYRSAPSISDTRKYACNFIYENEKPKDALRVTQDEQALMVARMSVFRSARHHTFGKWHNLSNCPQCNAELSKSFPSSIAREIGETLVNSCDACGFWEMEEILKGDWTAANPPPGEIQAAEVARSIHKRSVIRHFAVAGADVPIRSLSKFIKGNPEAIRHIHPKKMEELVGHTFRETMDCEIKHLGGPGDDGVDLLLVSAEKTFAIQVKRRSSPTEAEPVTSIREFLGALILKQQRNGIFVTSAPRFSGPAKSAANLAVELGAVDFLRLDDARDVLNIISGSKFEERPWEAYQSSSTTLADRVERGEGLFLDLAAGNPNWCVAPDSVPTKEGWERYSQILGLDKNKDEGV